MERLITNPHLLRAMRIGTSTYSFWHFLKEKVPIEHVMDRAYEMGLDGVEVLHVQMENEDRAYINDLKRHALELSLDIFCLAIHQNFVSPSEEERMKQVEHTKRCLEIAYRLGAPCIRLNSGRWNTIKSFDELMARKGIEPPIPGFSEEDAFGWVVDCINECLPMAEEHGVVMALENHWGLTSTPEGVNRIVGQVGSKWLRTLMDTGNFLEDPYTKLQKIAPGAILVHAKTYYGGGEWYRLDIDYGKVLKILRDINFKGYISIEYEGKESALTAVPKTIALLKKEMNR
jgi:L-ribulose-5-phosphate 3-epimerase